MTTTQELEALLEGCTQGDWLVSKKAEMVIFSDGQCVASCGGHSDNQRNALQLESEQKSNAKLMAMSKTLAAELIKERANSARLLEALLLIDPTRKFKGWQDVVGKNIGEIISNAIKQAEEAKMSKLTPWFSENVKPSYIGLYEVEFYIPTQEAFCWYAYFDGRQWGWMSSNIRTAKDLYDEDRENRHKKLCWRGLANEPKKFKQTKATK